MAHRLVHDHFARASLGPVGEHPLRVLAAHFFDHRPCHAIQDDESLVAILHVLARNDEDGRLQLRHPHFPVPSQPADLLFTASRVDLEQHHPSQVVRQLLQQQCLLLWTERVGLAPVGHLQQLDLRCDLKPRQAPLVHPL